MRLPSWLLLCEPLLCRRGHTYEHGSCRVEYSAKDTSEDLDRDWPWHGEKNHGRVRRKAFVSKRKASCVPEWTPLAAMEEERQIKCRCVLKKLKPNNKSIDRKPLKVKQQKQQQKKPSQSAFSKLSDTC